MSPAREVCAPDSKRRVRPALAGGFVLVGIVIMVLALTILGLSLFSLSTYESQFMQRSLDRQQALQSALGGLDRAKYALVAKDRLDQVKIGLPLENVFYARATQLQAVVDSSNAVVWSGNPIHIEAASRVDGLTCWAEGWYSPHEMVNYYRRLLTVSLSIQISLGLTEIPPDPRFQITMRDSVWLGGSDLSWLTGILGILPPYVANQAVPIPAAAAFISSHATAPDVVAGSDLYFHAPPGGPPAFWYTNHGRAPVVPPLTFSYYDKDDNGGAHLNVIHVTGRAVWCLPRGARFTYPVTVVNDGDPNACMVIVARDGLDGQGAGFDHTGAIWFFSGIQSSVPLILVSDDVVKIESQNIPTATTDVSNVSIFAGQVFLKGPQSSSTGYMTLGYHDAVMKAQLDFLMQFGALPNSVAPQQLTLIPGSWRVSQ